MDTENNVLGRLKTVIAAKTKLSEADIQPSLNFEDSGLDSFARIELILVIEEEFGIELSDNESANVATVSDLVELVEAKTA